MASPTVNFIGYNSTGIDKQKCAWIRDLCDLTDASYLAIQEHFKIAKTTGKQAELGVPHWEIQVELE